MALDGRRGKGSLALSGSDRVAADFPSVCCDDPVNSATTAFYGPHRGVEAIATEVENQLEDFLVHNWRSTALRREYDIFEEDGQIEGQQFPTDTGAMDILAIS
jgi:hypothetical protein